MSSENTHDFKMSNVFEDSNSDSEYDLQRYVSYTQERALETVVREKSEATRLERIQQNERTAEARKNELKSLFRRVDADLLLRRCQQIGESTAGSLRDVTNTPRATRIHKSQVLQGAVTRTEIVPMLPCKGYTLPRGNLFIGGKWAALDLHEWKYESSGLERLKMETMMKIHNIPTAELGKYEHDNQGEETVEFSNRADFSDWDSKPHKLESGARKIANGAISQIKNNVVSYDNNLGLDIEEEVWAYETAYL